MQWNSMGEFDFQCKNFREHNMYYRRSGVERYPDPTVPRHHMSDLLIDSLFTFIASKYTLTVKSALYAFLSLVSLFTSYILSSMIPTCMLMQGQFSFLVATRAMSNSHAKIRLHIYLNNIWVTFEIIILIRILKDLFNWKMSLLSRCFIINSNANNLK